MSVSSPAEPRLATAAARCVTAPWRLPGYLNDLLTLLPSPTGGLSFVTGGDGVVGWGSFATLRVTSADAAEQISRWFEARVAEIDVDDSVQLPGSGPVCFVSLGFAAGDESVAVIPQVSVSRRTGQTFMTRITGSAEDAATAVGSGASMGSVTANVPDNLDVRPLPVTGPGQVRYSDTELSTTDFMAAVNVAVSRIDAGIAAKVVLAHGLSATTESAVDERFLLSRLASRYPSCSIFAVDGLVGASPEMLLHRRGRHVSSRVLAGTAWPERSFAADRVIPDSPAGMHRVAADLMASAKDLAEHRFAAESVANALAPLTSSLHVPAAPSVLELANLTHLATDISGELTSPIETAPTALDLAALLHPTAAVGGTPSDVALGMIAELERAPRGRYAAPVGWLDTRGDGDFAIALRCAQVSGKSVTMMAGCGIVAGSDSEVEAREAQIKMLPIRDALEG
ncbi:MAG: chorismate-binding protein [Nakamurella sp.]